MSTREQPIILLIESDAALRRLIALGLYHRRMRVMTAGSLAAISTRLAQSPDIVLLDVDDGVESDWSRLNEARAHPLLSALPILVLSWDAPVLASSNAHPVSLTRIAYATKPFDARALHETVEDLLEARGLQAAASTRAVDDPAARPAMSIWPLITAVGLFIAIAGFLLQFILAIAGLLIVLVALLCWTLGATNSTPKENQLPVGYV